MKLVVPLLLSILAAATAQRDVGIRLRLKNQPSTPGNSCTEPEKQRLMKAITWGLVNQHGGNPPNPSIHPHAYQNWCEKLCFPKEQAFCDAVTRVCLYGKRRILQELDDLDELEAGPEDLPREFTDFLTKIVQGDHLFYEEDEPSRFLRKLSSQNDGSDVSLSPHDRYICEDIKDDVMYKIGENLGNLPDRCLRLMSEKLRLQCYFRDE